MAVLIERVPTKPPSPTSGADEVVPALDHATQVAQRFATT